MWSHISDRTSSKTHALNSPLSLGEGQNSIKELYLTFVAAESVAAVGAFSQGAVPAAVLPFPRTLLESPTNTDDSFSTRNYPAVKTV